MFFQICFSSVTRTLDLERLHVGLLCPTAAPCQPPREGSEQRKPSEKQKTNKKTHICDYFKKSSHRGLIWVTNTVSEQEKPVRDCSHCLAHVSSPREAVKAAADPAHVPEAGGLLRPCTVGLGRSGRGRGAPPFLARAASPHHLEPEGENGAE